MIKLFNDIYKFVVRMAVQACFAVGVGLALVGVACSFCLTKHCSAGLSLAVLFLSLVLFGLIWLL